ncbi:DEAD/DEAH box helicase [soil metagenome]
MSFDRLGLAPELVRAVADQGYTEPTPVQLQAIPFVLAGRDLLAAAQTGTGKTAAFVLPILQRLSAPRPDAQRRARPIRALVLVPTRELALQVEESVRTYGAHRPLRSTTIYGGVGFNPQVRNLRTGADIVVATPGRLLDHVGQRTIDLGSVEILVLDEADRMLDMGFIHDIRRILALLPERRQNLLFSATFSTEIRRLAEGLLDDPASVQVAARNTPPELVTQLVHPVDRERKRELLSQLVRSRRVDQALVFTRTKHGANRLAQQLERDGIAATAIHGNKSQPQRVRALDDFKQGRVTLLVATEVAARGLDIESLPHVVNFELPTVPSDYLHRIGRTGRAGVDGEAISLVCVDEAKLLRDIERLLGRPIPAEVVPGFEPDRNIRAEPILLRSAPGQRSTGGRSGAGRRPGPVQGSHIPASGNHVAARRPAAPNQGGHVGGGHIGGGPIGGGPRASGFAEGPRRPHQPARTAGASPRSGDSRKVGDGRRSGDSRRPGSSVGMLPGERFARRGGRVGDRVRD